MDDLCALPSSVLFGTVPVGGKRSVAVAVQSRRRESFTVNRVETTSDAVSVRADGQASDGMPSYLLTLSPAALGRVEERVTFHLGRPGRDDELVQVLLRCEAVSDRSAGEGGDAGT